ncbi:MAG TPA: FAD binding domain-containing protein [Kofleriaceae bacterium]|nr:FAD binding domain-containing protein [Kofleriaceae bacterium]
MKNFQFHRPKSVADAVKVLKGNPAAKALAGGQSLLPMMKLDLTQPGDLVSLGGLAELRAVRVDGKTLLVGALASHDEVSRSTAIAGLAALAAGIGDAQVRNRGTIGGSIAHADPAADYPAALVALGATVATDRRRIPADSFFTGLFASALEPDELVTAVHFPVPERCGYAKFGHRASKFAVVGVMVAKTAGGVRVAVTGAGPSVFRVPEMEAALGKRFDPAALDGITVPAGGLQSDSEASAEFRAHLVGVMARRAVASA